MVLRFRVECLTKENKWIVLAAFPVKSYAVRWIATLSKYNPGVVFRLQDHISLERSDNEDSSNIVKFKKS
jgi:hypothetical protein